MRSKRHFFACLACAALLFATVFDAAAQENVNTGEKASTKWENIITRNYKVVFPVGLDSLGTSYATQLEYFRPRVGASAGFLPNQQYRRQMPVILHPHLAMSNGFVAWAPRRMELYTFADPYGFLPPVPWETILSIHENRHVAQDQVGRSGVWKWLHYPFGEKPASYAGNLLCNPAMAEGDAVALETAYTHSGRGRTADFLSYYRMSFDNGDFRNWNRWRYGSQRRYTPDHYRIGYMTVAGARYTYDAPMFMAEYLDKNAHARSFDAMSGTLKMHSGKRLKDSWIEIAHTFAGLWAEDDTARGPFQEIVPLTAAPSRFFNAYTEGVETADGRLFATRSGLDRTLQLIEILPDGEDVFIRPFGNDSRMAYSPLTDCLYWTESVPDVRWEQYSESRIRMMKAGEKKISDFTPDGRYANPAVSEDGSLLAAVEYPLDGSCRIVLFHVEDGSVAATIGTQPGLRATTLAFCGKELVFTGVCNEGMGLYKTDFVRTETLVEPVPIKIKEMIAHDGKVYFTSDRTGTDEIYSCDPEGTVLQHTNTKYGVGYPFFRNGTLCFTALLPEGRLLACADRPMERRVSLADRCTYPVAEALTEQERQLPLQEATTEIVEHSRFSKAKNLIHIHSWIPYYQFQDDITRSMTGFEYEKTAVGATVFFQNLPTTLDGSVGVSLHEDPFDSEELNGGLHVRARYTGLFPVFEFGLDVGDRSSVNTVRGLSLSPDTTFVKSFKADGKPAVYVGGRMIVSLPLNFSSGGWMRQVQPYAAVSASTDQLGGGYRLFKYDAVEKQFVPVMPVTENLHQNINWQVGISGEASLGTASSAIFPKWGLGGGVRFQQSPFAKAGYASLYAYLPGFTSVHGWKIHAEAQVKNPAESMAPADVWALGMANLAPRGYEDSSAGALLNIYRKGSAKFSVDYAMPILPMDFSIGRLLYLRNMELIPFFDYTLTGRETGKGTDSLTSVGAEIMLHLEKLLIIENSIKAGLRVSYNGGSLYEQIGMETPVHIGFVSSLDF